MLRELQLAGIIVPAVRDVWVDHTDDDEGGETWINCAFEVPVTKLQNLLWCAVVTDLGSLRPNPRCHIYLINFQNGIVCHPYDDRGMDVIGRQKAALAEIYARHCALLLAYDANVIHQTFAQT